MNKLKSLINKIKESQTAYYNGSEIISDDEYDALIYELAQLDPKNALLVSVGAKPTEEWKKEKHTYPLGSLNKVNFPNEMEKWISETLNNTSVLVVEKLDGLSIGCQYENGKLTKACLRGSGFEGENIFDNVVKMKGCVKQLNDSFTGTIRGEICLKKSDHQTHFADYSNPRNAASGLCRRLDGTGSEHLTLMMYDIISDEDLETEASKFIYLNNNSFIVPNFKLCKTANEVNSLWKEYQSSIRDSLDWEIDGLVVSANDIELQKSLGETNLRSKGKMAFKFANQFIKTTITDIVWGCGNSGRITPVCWFESVSLLGSDIEKASVYNIRYITELGIGIGADVLVCKANEIIPRVEKVLKPGKSVAVPTNCPSCDAELQMIGENLTCLNKLSCQAQTSGRIKNWVAKLNILEFGEAIVERLVESGLVSTPADLYKLTKKDLMTLERMGEKSAENCLNSLNSKKEITLDVLVGSLSITMNSESTVKLAVAAGFNTLEKLHNARVEDLIKINGFGEIKAQHLIEGLKANKEIINQLLENGVIMKKNIEGKLTGMSFCFSGALSQKRAVFEDAVVENGGEVKGSVGKTLTYLVLADPNSGSSKSVAAKKNGTKVISEEEFFNLIA